MSLRGNSAAGMVGFMALLGGCTFDTSVPFIAPPGEEADSGVQSPDAVETLIDSALPADAELVSPDAEGGILKIVPVGGISPTAQIGGTGGEKMFNRLCPEDAFVYGFESKTHNNAEFPDVIGLCEVQVKCASLVSENGQTKRIEVAPLSPVGTCGGVNVPVTTDNPGIECSDNKIVVGLEILSTFFVTDLTLRCASVAVSGGGLTISLDPISSGLGRVDCPDNQVAVGLGGRSGFVIDRMGLGCKEVEITR